MGLTHHGKATGARNAAPVKSVVVDIQHLREELKKAISEEDFEKAARLRDEIRGLESETKA
jgi:protein-arginine kinase activator protein McsA